MTYSAFAGWTDPGPEAVTPRMPFIPRPVGGSAWTLHPATAADEPAIRALVRAERMNPTGLRHPTFIVARVGPRVVGCAQIRRHRDGSREFGSLVVAPDFRGQGIATALARTLLAHEHDRLHVITSGEGARTYERLGFRRIPGRLAPRAVRLNLRIGQLAGLLTRLRGGAPLGLCVLERPDPWAAKAVAWCPPVGEAATALP